MRPFLVLFIVMPILEMWVLISVGQKIGALPTIGLVLLTAVVGVALLRRQGISTLMRAQQKMQAGELPAQEMMEGMCLAVGGALLLTPGFVTDAIGFACLIPGLRQLVLGRVLRHVAQGTPGSGRPSGSAEQRNPGAGQHDIIEGDYRREDESEIKPDKGSEGQSREDGSNKK